GRALPLLLSRLAVPGPLSRPADGSPRAARRDRDGCGPHGGRVDAGHAGAPAVAPLRHPRRARRWRRRLSRLYGSGALPPQLVRAPEGFGHEPRLLGRRRGLDHPAALARDSYLWRRLARRLLRDGA